MLPTALAVLLIARAKAASIFPASCSAQASMKALIAPILDMRPLKLEVVCLTKARMRTFALFATASGLAFISLRNLSRRKRSWELGYEIF